MSFLKSLSKSILSGAAPAPRGKEGARAYAVGDVHGRLDLLDDLLARIERDNEARPAATTFLIFVGDLIDRGPSSAGVVERLRTYSNPAMRPIFLLGNHEEAFLRVLGGDEDILPNWLSFGGSECAESYGVDPRDLTRLAGGPAIELLHAAVPREHIDFLEGFVDTFRFGDYLFVHAGIRPGVAIEEQEPKDLRWIRQPFLSDNKEHGVMVVHGHTICSAVEERRNRIGIDTGAYRTGVLTAVGIEGGERWYLATGGSADWR